MQSTTNSKSYERAINVAPTSGFINDKATIFKQDDPADKFFEPSPIIVGNFNSNLAWVTGVLNFGLHAACLVITCIAGFEFIGTTGPMTQYHNTDYIKQIGFVYVICEILAVLWTVGWFAVVHRAMETAPAAFLGLALQLLSTVSATLLSYWVMMAPKTLGANALNDPETMAADRRPSGMDTMIILSMYLGWLVIAGYIMTPISGVYLKTK